MNNLIRIHPVSQITTNVLWMHVKPVPAEMLQSTSQRSHTEAQQWFVEQGLAVSEWAISRGFNPALVYAVLHGRRKCLRGQSHRIAVALGLKATPEGAIVLADQSLVGDVQPMSKEPSMSP
jgi:gp16 family phage-associated protein